MGRDENKKQKKAFFILIFITISFSFCQFFYLGRTDYSLIGKSEREKLIILVPEYYELLYFAYDIIEPGETVLFLEIGYYLYGQPLYYPEIISLFLDYDRNPNDQEFYDYIEDNIVNYVLVFYIDFPPSTNSTLFAKYAFDSTRYLLEINRTVL